MGETPTRPDPHCPICNGSGTIIDNEKIDEDGGYWCTFIDCDCRSIVAAAARRALEES